MSTIASRMAGWPRYSTIAIACLVVQLLSSWAPLLAVKMGGSVLLSISVLLGLFGQLGGPACIVCAVVAIVKKESPRWLPLAVIAFLALQFVLGIVGVLCLYDGHGHSW